ncbi:hypothetical protein ACFWIA_28775 [Streptomyces sp. NPDC127068]
MSTQPTSDDRERPTIHLTAPPPPATPAPPVPPTDDRPRPTIRLR